MIPRMGTGCKCNSMLNRITTSLGKDRCAPKETTQQSLVLGVHGRQENRARTQQPCHAPFGTSMASFWLGLSPLDAALGRGDGIVKLGSLLAAAARPLSCAQAGAGTERGLVSLCS